ncbi:MAG: Rieske 2Fe-2S domain-containing protein [Pseudomonadota bacterium]
MSHDYVPVQWNRFKLIYDLVLWASIVVYLAAFIGISSVTVSGKEALSFEILLIRALATCAFVLLTLIVCIGPLARLSPRFLPLLYNRRHLGVSMFLVALAHAGLATLWYHGFGVTNPIASIFSSPGSLSHISDFPFQPFGALALFVFLLMAATSHDFWNANLGAPLWKALHMLVYPAYGLITLHVATGAMQSANTGFSPVLLGASVTVVGGLHIAALLRSRGANRSARSEEWVSIGSWRDIADNSGIVVRISRDERVAVFRYEGNKLAAVSNVCKHQAGPLGEGRVIDGCITCPWHGFQYRPEDGRAPPPFTEKLATYNLRLEGDVLFLHTVALPEGTARPVLEVQA